MCVARAAWLARGADTLSALLALVADLTLLRVVRKGSSASRRVYHLVSGWTVDQDIHAVPSVPVCDRAHILSWENRYLKSSMGVFECMY